MDLHHINELSSDLSEEEEESSNIDVKKNRITSHHGQEKVHQCQFCEKVRELLYCHRCKN